MHQSTFRKWSSGQSIVEFLIVFPLLVMLVFGIIQFALMYQARATLNHATMLAARAGAIHNGNKVEMRRALAKGLTPLFASEPSMQGYDAAFHRAIAETDQFANLADVKVLNPTKATLVDFGRSRLDGAGGRELPSDTLSYRSTTPGTNSRISVQDANLLHLRVRYCYRLIVPLMDRVIYAGANALGPSSPALSGNGMHDPLGTGGFTLPSRECLNPSSRGLRIVIQSEAIIRMQSPFFESNL